MTASFPSTQDFEAPASTEAAKPAAATTVGWPRVLLFTDSDAFAGTERHILDLAASLPAQGVGVGIACPSPSPLAERAANLGVPVTPIAKRGLLDQTALKSLRSLFKQNAVDVIHVHNGRTAMLAAMAHRLARRGHCVSTQHFITPNRVNRTGIKAVLSRMAHGWVASHTDRFIAVSRAVERGMAERDDGHPGRIFIIPNGIAEFDAATIKPADTIRQELGIGPQVPLIVAATRLAPEKAVDSLIDAMAQLRTKHPTACCAIAGEGSEHQALASRIEHLGLGDAVRLLGFRNDVASIIAACDVFVLPSVNEPFGLVLIEAMSLSKPVVSTAAGGPLEIVEEASTGLLVSPRRPDALADAIGRLLADRPAAREMGRRGRLHFEKHYTAGAMAAATAAVYRRAVAGDDFH
jgi:glycosyltransferase involved in cell wall biosynthesis